MGLLTGSGLSSGLIVYPSIVAVAVPITSFGFNNTLVSNEGDYTLKAALGTVAFQTSPKTEGTHALVTTGALYETTATWPTPTGAMTVTGDVYLTGYPGTQSAFLSQYVNTGNLRSWSIGINSTGTPILQISTNGSTVVSSSSSTAITLNTWIAFKFVFNPGVKFSLFLDNALATESTTTVTSLFNPSLPLAIGKTVSNLSSKYIPGAIDNVKIYNQVV